MTTETMPSPLTVLEDVLQYLQVLSSVHSIPLYELTSEFSNELHKRATLELPQVLEIVETSFLHFEETIEEMMGFLITTTLVSSGKIKVEVLNQDFEVMFTVAEVGLDKLDYGLSQARKYILRYLDIDFDQMD